MKVELNRLLVCRTDAIGDSLLTLPVCTNLKKYFPHSQVTFMTSRYTADLYQGQEHVDQLLIYDPQGEHQGRRGMKQLITTLKARHFDAALMIYPDKRLSWAVSRARIPLRLGTGRRWWSWLYNKKIWHSRKQAVKHEAEYNLDYISALGFKPVLVAPRLIIANEQKKQVARLLVKLGISKLSNLVIVHPGGRGSSANWSQRAYQEFVFKLLDQPGLQVLLTGVGPEIQANQAIALYCKNHGAKAEPAMLNFKINLNMMAALIEHAQVFVSGNTGPMHIAAAVDTPLIALFPNSGVTGPIRWKPLSSTSTIFMPKENDQSADTQAISAKQINPELVVSKIKSILSSR